MTMRFSVTGLVWLVGAVLCGVVIAFTRFSADMSAFLPRSPQPTQQILVDQIENGAASRLVLIAIQNAPIPVLADLSRELASRLRQDQAFTSVNNGDDSATALAPEGDFLWRNRYILSPAVTPTSFTVEGLRLALNSDLRLLASDLGGLVKSSLPADPTGEMLVLLDQFAGQSQANRQEGVWFSPGGERALLVAQTRNPGFDITSEEQAVALLNDSFLAAQQTVSGAAGATLLMTGPGIFAVHTKAEMKEDISRLSLVATILVSAILLFTYRSARILVLALLPVASGALAGVAAVSLGFGYVHGITLGFGVTLMGEAVDYAIYLFTQTTPGTTTDTTLPRIWPMLRLGVLVSVCGFSSMLFSSFTGFAQLGLFSITGLLVAAGVTRWVLPVLVQRDFSGARTTLFAPALLAVMLRAKLLRLPALILVLGALIFIAMHRGDFWEDDLTSLSPIPTSDQTLDRSLRSDIGAPDVRYLIVASAPDEQEVLAMTERLSSALEDLEAQGAIGGFDAATRYLPSVATQRARLDALPAPGILRARLGAALQDLPFRADLFEPFIADVAAAQGRPLLDRGSLQGTSLTLKLDSLLVQRQGMWSALLTLRSVIDAPRVTQRISQLEMTGVTFVDLKTESDKLLGVYRREALPLAAIGSMVIVALLTVSLRSPRRIVMVVAPLAGAVVLTAAILTLGSHRLSIFNLVGLLLTVAVGSNYCIFFERQNWTDAGAERTVVSVVLANICTVIGFGILSFARLPVLHGIGTTVAVGTFLSLVLAAIVTSRDSDNRGGARL